MMNQVVDFFSLGGLDEKNKNLYCLNISGELFLFNVGSKQVEKPTLGVNEVIADFTYLSTHKSVVKAIFLTSAISSCAGGLHHLIRMFPSVPVYISATAGRFLKCKYKSDHIFLPKLQFQYVWPRKVINLGSVRIEVFRTNSEFPDSIGFAVYTSAGTVIFTGTNVFDFSKVNNHAVELNHLSQIAKVQKVLLLLADAPYANYLGYAVPKFQINHFLRGLNFTPFQRVIFFSTDDDLYKIDSFIRLVRAHFPPPLTIQVIGQNLYNIIEIQKANSDKYQRINFTTTEPANVILVGGHLKFLYDKMIEIGVAGHIGDQELTNQDLILLALPLVFGQELSYAHALDQLARTDAIVHSLPANKLHQMKPHAEDIKLLVDLFRPQFFVPTNGLYKELLAACDAASATGMKRSYCFSLKNGTLLKMRANKFTQEPKAIPTGDVYITAGSHAKTEPVIVEERKQLGINGAVIISFLVDHTKKIISTIQVLNLGVSVDNSNNRWLDQVKTVCSEVADKYQTQFNQTKNYPIKEIRSEIYRMTSKIIRQQLSKRPIILTVIEDTNL